MTAQEAISNAYAAGANTAVCQRKRDQPGVTFHREHFQRFRNLYKNLPGLQPSELDLHYSEGYRDEMHGLQVD